MKTTSVFTFLFWVSSHSDQVTQILTALVPVLALVVAGMAIYFLRDRDGKP